MNDVEVLATIVQYGLSIRQIPLKVVSTYHIRHYKEGDEIVEIKGVEYCRRTRIPANPGYWMCKQVRNTSSMVSWDIKTDNLAPTLSESVALFLNGV